MKPITLFITGMANLKNPAQFIIEIAESENNYVQNYLSTT